MSKKEQNRGGGSLDSVTGSSIPNGKNYLFLIAIDEYKDGGFENLYNCKGDAEEIREILWKKYQFKEENTIKLYDNDATGINILSVLDDFLIGAKSLNENDNLIFLFSGHGMYYKDIDEGFWITHKSIKGKKGSYLPNSQIIARIKNIEARHVVGFIDSCYASTLFRNVEKESDNEKETSFIATIRSFKIPSRYLMTAGRLEPVSDGSLGKNSPFAKSLITHLKYNDALALQVSTLGERVLDGVIRNAKQTPRHAPLQNAGDEGGMFVFLKKEANFKDLERELEPEKIDNGNNDKGSSKKEVEIEDNLQKKYKRIIWLSLLFVLTTFVSLTAYFVNRHYVEEQTLAPLKDLGIFSIEEVFDFKTPKIEIEPTSFSNSLSERALPKFYNFKIYNKGTGELIIDSIITYSPWIKINSTDTKNLNIQDSLEIMVEVNNDNLNIGENLTDIFIFNNDTVQKINFKIYFEKTNLPPPRPILWDTIPCTVKCEGIIIKYTYNSIEQTMKSIENGFIEVILPRNWRGKIAQIEPVSYFYSKSPEISYKGELFPYENGCLNLPDTFETAIHCE